MKPADGIHEFDGVAYVKLDDYAEVDRHYRRACEERLALMNLSDKLTRRVRQMDMQLPVRVRRAKYAGLVGTLRRKLGR